MNRSAIEVFIAKRTTCAVHDGGFCGARTGRDRADGPSVGGTWVGCPCDSRA